MELFSETLFGVVILLCSLHVSSLPIMDSNISFMRTSVTCPSDSVFYAPENVEKQCVTTALDCIMKELKGTVREECSDPEADINDALQFFKRMIKDRTQGGQAMTDSSECACERWSEKPFSQFLDQVEALLQSENPRQNKGG